MQGRSWMAALAGTIVAATLLLARHSPSARADEPAAPAGCKVILDVAIDGLGAKGCDLEIKPGHAGCQFKTITRHVPGLVAVAGKATVVSRDAGKVKILVDDARTTSVDRNCIFAITIREPGHEPKTFHRGLRLSTTSAGRSTPDQTLSCYLRSPSKLAKADEEKVRK